MNSLTLAGVCTDNGENARSQQRVRPSIVILYKGVSAELVVVQGMMVRENVEDGYLGAVMWDLIHSERSRGSEA